MKLALITGGARSGKSTYAEEMVTNIGNKIAYIATAKVTDEDMADRIKRHQQSRPKEWLTIEQYSNFENLMDHEAFNEIDTFLLDCVTVLITNIMFEQEIDYDHCSMEEVNQVEKLILNEIKKLLELMKKKNKTLILVTNEVGMGLVSSYRLGNLFRDIAGRINAYIAKQCDEVYFMVSSIPMKVK